MKKTKDEQLGLGATEEGEILSKLSERVERAVAIINDLRRERDALKARLDEAEGKTSERVSELEEENDRFNRERGEIRNRIEGILSSLEVLDET